MRNAPVNGMRCKGVNTTGARCKLSCHMTAQGVMLCTLHWRTMQLDLTNVPAVFRFLHPQVQSDIRMFLLLANRCGMSKDIIRFTLPMLIPSLEEAPGLERSRKARRKVQAWQRISPSTNCPYYQSTNGDILCTANWKGEVQSYVDRNYDADPLNMGFVQEDLNQRDDSDYICFRPTDGLSKDGLARCPHHGGPLTRRAYEFRTYSPDIWLHALMKRDYGLADIRKCKFMHKSGQRCTNDHYEYNLSDLDQPLRVEGYCPHHGGPYKNREWFNIFSWRCGGWRENGEPYDPEDDYTGQF